ncbi:4-(cytidine 5'-diphospho)-2-C-methyl-D-erythritol kinase [Rhodococcus sp. HNM0569]|uniref:4-(cytidine 5'-diphospho)-2-C-methyl-D-erythritol kinase n=1 Tax=Rhodococcus sp. HNM0569 TaxID=2716340 RepID=UPI001469D0A8|nr:4-(cytidine 5'-diphospho)-2-C-methyl-D-erythritol kinase [Rhodococcus sp. HNM0569]
MLSVVHSPLVVRAPSKVNLHLGVGDLRDDGYHELTTVFQALSLSDTVSVVPADELGVTVRGADAASVPADSTNLAWKAAELVGAAVGRTPGVHITIDKGIPVAGGMAGGSADAAATLVALNALWQLDLPRTELDALAARLGSDVPFGLHGGTALGTGRGEKLLPVLARNTFHWVLALAKTGLSTPVVFGELDRLRASGQTPRLGDTEPLLHALAAGDAAALAPLLGNDLQAAALSLDPSLRRTLRAGVTAGALAGIVSGSGPTCAFLCSDRDSAVEVSAELAGAGVCRTVRIATGPVAGAREVKSESEESH